jgi:hypothetical protein
MNKTNDTLLNGFDIDSILDKFFAFHPLDLVDSHIEEGFLVSRQNNSKNRLD